MLITVKLLLQRGIPLQVDPYFFLIIYTVYCYSYVCKPKACGQPIRRKLAQRAEEGKTASLREVFYVCSVFY